MNEPVIKKIEFSLEEQEEIERINKGEAVPKIKVVTNKNGYSYEYTTNKRFSREVAKKRLIQLYGGICTGCGLVWPDYKVTYKVGDEKQPATLVRRYCSPCLDKWKDRL